MYRTISGCQSNDTNKHGSSDSSQMKPPIPDPSIPIPLKNTNQTTPPKENELSDTQSKG